MSRRKQQRPQHLVEEDNNSNASDSTLVLTNDDDHHGDQARDAELLDSTPGNGEMIDEQPASPQATEDGLGDEKVEDNPQPSSETVEDATPDVVIVAEPGKESPRTLRTCRQSSPESRRTSNRRRSCTIFYNVDHEDKKLRYSPSRSPGGAKKPKVENLMCPYCLKEKKSRSDLQRHLRSHTGEKPFVCQVCKKEFKSKRSVQYHEYMEHGIESTETNLMDRYRERKMRMELEKKVNSGYLGVYGRRSQGKYKSFDLYNSDAVSGLDIKMEPNDWNGIESNPKLDTDIPDSFSKMNGSIGGKADMILSPTNGEIDQEMLSFHENLQSLVNPEYVSGKLNDSVESKSDCTLSPQKSVPTVVDLGDDSGDSMIFIDKNGGAYDDEDLESGDERNLSFRDIANFDLGVTMIQPDSAVDSDSRSTGVTVEPESNTIVLDLETVQLETGIDVTNMTKEEKRAYFLSKRTCLHCGKVCPKPSDLKRHLLVHTGERPYKCRACDRAFKSKGSLQYHEKTNHNINIDLSQGMKERYLRVKENELRRNMMHSTGVTSYDISKQPCYELFSTRLDTGIVQQILNQSLGDFSESEPPASKDYPQLRNALGYDAKSMTGQWMVVREGKSTPDAEKFTETSNVMVKMEPVDPDDVVSSPGETATTNTATISEPTSETSTSTITIPTIESVRSLLAVSDSLTSTLDSVIASLHSSSPTLFDTAPKTKELRSETIDTEPPSPSQKDVASEKTSATNNVISSPEIIATCATTSTAVTPSFSTDVTASISDPIMSALASSSTGTHMESTTTSTSTHAGSTSTSTSTHAGSTSTSTSTHVGSTSTSTHTGSTSTSTSTSSSTHAGSTNTSSWMPSSTTQMIITSTSNQVAGTSTITSNQVAGTSTSTQAASLCAVPSSAAVSVIKQIFNVTAPPKTLPGAVIGVASTATPSAITMKSIIRAPLTPLHHNPYLPSRTYHSTLHYGPTQAQRNVTERLTDNSTLPSERLTLVNNATTSPVEKSSPTESLPETDKILDNYTISKEMPFVARVDAVDKKSGECVVLYKCYLCMGKTFDHLSKILEHMSSHVGTGNQLPYRCPVCQASFKFRIILLRHLRSLHHWNIEEKDDFASKVGEGQPIRNLDLAPKDRPVVLENSQINDVDVDDLNDQLSDIEMLDDMSLSSTAENSSLDIDDEGLKVPDSDSDIMKNLHNSNQQISQLLDSAARPRRFDGLFRCRFCSKTFYRFFCLQRHERVHTGVKTCFCKQCGRGFSELRNLRHHILRFHSGLDRQELFKLLSRGSPSKKVAEPYVKGLIGREHAVSVSTARMGPLQLPLHPPERPLSPTPASVAIGDSPQKETERSPSTASETTRQELRSHLEEKIRRKEGVSDDVTIVIPSDMPLDGSPALSTENEDATTGTCTPQPQTGAAGDLEPEAEAQEDRPKSPDGANEDITDSNETESEQKDLDKIIVPPIKTEILDEEIKDLEEEDKTASPNNTSPCVNPPQIVDFGNPQLFNSNFLSPGGLAQPFGINSVPQMNLPLTVNTSGQVGPVRISPAGPFSLSPRGPLFSPPHLSPMMPFGSPLLNIPGNRSMFQAPIMTSTVPTMTQPSFAMYHPPAHVAPPPRQPTGPFGQEVTRRYPLQDCSAQFSESESNENGERQKNSNLSRTNSRVEVICDPQKHEESSTPIFLPDGRTLFRCAYCAKEFPNYSDIRRHLNFHEDVRPFKCKMCQYSARTSSQLKVHMMRHQGIREFKCHICRYEGVTQSDLNRHLRSQSHLYLERMGNKCKKCGEDYTSRQIMNHGHICKAPALNAAIAANLGKNNFKNFKVH